MIHLTGPAIEQALDWAAATPESYTDPLTTPALATAADVAVHVRHAVVREVANLLRLGVPPDVVQAGVDELVQRDLRP